MEKLRPLNKKLYILRDIEGEINKEEIGILRELNERFKQYNWYIGLSPMGSTVRNYRIKGSDIDCKLIYDGSKTSRFEVIKLVKLISGEIEKSHGFQSGHIGLAYITEFNSDQIKKGLFATGQEYTDTLLTIRDLSGIILGRAPEKYRDVVRNILSSLSREDRQRIAEQIVTFCIGEERLGEGKIVQRIGLSQKALAQLWEARKKLWTNRINTMWFE